MHFKVARYNHYIYIIIIIVIKITKKDNFIICKK